MFQATRCRLALWYTGVTAVLLLFFATGVYVYVRSTLIERVDDTLKHVVEVVERSLIIQPTPGSDVPYRVNIEASFRDNTNTVDDDHIDLEWFSPNGELLWSTLSEPLDIPLNLNPMGKTVHLAADHLLRQVTERVETERHVLGYLRVSHPWFEVTKPIQQLIIDLTLGTLIMVLSVAAIGWFLSGIAMEPVRKSYQSLKQFTADASHELRNPIAMIQMNVQMALSYPDLDTHLQRQQLKVIERLTQRLGRLVNDLLFLARSDSGMVQLQQQSVPLDALLMEVIEEQQLVAAEKGISLSLNLLETPTSNELHKSDNAFTLLGDWDQLARLFTNLVSNAVQYTPTSKEASVQVELQQTERLGTVGGRHPQSLLQVQVRDTGSGISEEALSHIFDRFYRVDLARTHDTAAGSGLGLAIAKAIVENHHGSIQVASVLNQGSTVTVSLPAYQGSLKMES
ncbi:MAG: HAMP domain-containing histidine kinase [Kastovskya adunca ATA6-11-RM4]|jgi:OmpR-family two-component system manganese-sensing sensor histidine kinase|nr:HAMP domain-containing histidine kinase [Kastovskya adunca ATA6-11-RM4]